MSGCELSRVINNQHSTDTDESWKFNLIHPSPGKALSFAALPPPFHPVENDFHFFFFKLKFRTVVKINIWGIILFFYGAEKEGFVRDYSFAQLEDYEIFYRVESRWMLLLFFFWSRLFVCLIIWSLKFFTIEKKKLCVMTSSTKQPI